MAEPRTVSEIKRAKLIISAVAAVLWTVVDATVEDGQQERHTVAYRDRPGYNVRTSTETALEKPCCYKS